MLVSIVADQGSRGHQEDHSATGAVANGLGHAAAVFDGHSGAELSSLCASRFTPVLHRHLQAPGDGVRALVRCLEDMDAEALARYPDCPAGTTACAVLVLPTSIVTANVGDSRAVLWTREGAVDLSVDHKPVGAEADRIYRCGGFVSQRPGDAHRVIGRLSTSRSLGDYGLRPYVSPVPEVTERLRTPAQDEFVVIASDGVWDVMSSHEVTQAVRDHLLRRARPEVAMRRVIDECRRRGSGDNITIVFMEVGRRVGPAVL